MSNVINFSDKKKEKEESNSYDFSDIIKLNMLKKKKEEKERLQENRKVLKSYEIK